METPTGLQTEQTAKPPKRGGSRLPYILGIVFEGLVILAILVVGAFVIYRMYNSNTLKTQQLAAMTSDRDSLKSQLADTTTKLNSATDLAKKNGDTASQLEKQNKDLQENLTKTSADLKDSRAKNDQVNKNYTDMTTAFDNFKGIVVCGERTLKSPDYQSNDTIQKALVDYVEYSDGPVQKKTYFKFFTGSDTAIHEIDGKDYYWVFVVTSEKAMPHRNSVYFVNGGCYLDPGVGQ